LTIGFLIELRQTNQSKDVHLAFIYTKEANLDENKEAGIISGLFSNCILIIVKTLLQRANQGIRLTFP